MVNLICGWCREEFNVEITRAKGTEKKSKGGRTKVICPHCGRTLPSSKKESTGKIVGKQHIHVEYKSGDVAG